MSPSNPRETRPLERRVRCVRRSIPARSSWPGSPSIDEDVEAARRDSVEGKKRRLRWPRFSTIGAPPPTCDDFQSDYARSSGCEHQTPPHIGFQSRQSTGPQRFRQPERSFPFDVVLSTPSSIRVKTRPRLRRGPGPGPSVEVADRRDSDARPSTQHRPRGVDVVPTQKAFLFSTASRRRRGRSGNRGPLSHTQPELSQVKSGPVTMSVGLDRPRSSPHRRRRLRGDSLPKGRRFLIRDVFAMWRRAGNGRSFCFE
jgi:hypothetical protein